jgi:hypothetical protein
LIGVKSGQALWRMFDAGANGFKALVMGSGKQEE